MNGRNQDSPGPPVGSWEYWKQFTGGLMQIVTFAVGTVIVLIAGLLFLLWLVAGHTAR